MALSSKKRFRPYSAYKDSRVGWLGQVPSHWDMAPVYSRYHVALGKMLDTKRATGDSPGAYLHNVDVQWDHVNVDSLPQMDFASSERERYLLRAGDILVCEGGEIGRTAIWRGEMDQCFYQKAVHRVRPQSTRDIPRYFYYLMRSLAERGVFVAGGNPNTIDHLTADQLRHYRLPFAQPEEQRAIAAFLDRETAKIDSLVAKNERLIELLRERRTALIARTVTKGLDSSVSLTDTGIDWFGRIPEHWHTPSECRMGCFLGFGSSLHRCGVRSPVGRSQRQGRRPADSGSRRRGSSSRTSMRGARRYRTGDRESRLLSFPP